MFKNGKPPVQIVSAASPDSSFYGTSQDPKRSTGKLEAEFTSKEVCIFDQD